MTITNYSSTFSELRNDFPHLEISVLERRLERSLRNEKLTQKQIKDLLLLESLDYIDQETPDWTFISARLLLEEIYDEAKKNRGKSLNFPLLIKSLVKEKVYDPKLLTSYSEKELKELANDIDYERDKLFNYIGLHTLQSRYLATKKNGDRMELPQERFMIIAMALMINEKKDKIKYVKEAYWALSNLYMTVATPTLANAGTVNGQLSSCFIDTVKDDLRAIYDSNTDAGQVSKNGGGLGLYLGKIRSQGSAIREVDNASSGVISWMKLFNTTAVSVDQLGKRKGAIAVYLDVWHKDIFSFLEAKLNNGDERKRTHDIFTGVCIPDIFMEAVIKRDNWYLFDPHEVKQLLGFSIEDYYDEEVGKGSFRQKYQQLIDHPLLSRKEVPAIEIMKGILKGQMETGTPFMVYRDTINRRNPNKHVGMIYCPNLCTEVIQNQSPSEILKEYINERGNIVTEKVPGDYVVCNLSSISLAKAVPDNVLERLISIQVRMLDNVIDINNLPILQAKVTNDKYRAIGLGTFGFAHLLAIEKIDWESDEAVKYTDDLYEDIAYLTIEASMNLAKERGSYSQFEGSDWQTGEYFTQRGYHRRTRNNWLKLQENVEQNGIRNGYLMAVAPNATTSFIGGSTASIDPIYKLSYSEEKKDSKIPVTAPGLTPENEPYYKSAYDIDQTWSIKQNIKRQKHIDQAVSFNIYIDPDIKAPVLLDYHIDAWNKGDGCKTSYYTRSKAESKN